jgi:hypothetical protein
VQIVHPEATDPLNLTKEAIRLRDERNYSSKHNNYNVAYDEVWVVFDFESPNSDNWPKANEAMRLPEASGLFFASSAPCFEYWLLLHVAYTTAQLLNCDAVTTELKRHWGEFSESAIPSVDFINKLPVAVKGAKQCRKYHIQAAGNKYPSTEVDLLAIKLNAAALEEDQFSLD